MTENLRKSLDILRNISPELNKAMDDANRVVAVVEKFLTEECNIGISASVVFEDEALAKCKFRNIYLKYGRFSNRFCIHINKRIWETFHNDDGIEVQSEYDETNMAWESCPRALRLKAFKQLPQLLEKIVEETSAIISQTTGTADVVEQMMSPLNANGEQPHNTGQISPDVASQTLEMFNKGSDTND